MNTLNVHQIEGGTVIKQGDHDSLFVFDLQDEQYRGMNLDGKEAQIRLVSGKGAIAYEQTVRVQYSKVSFQLEKVLAVGSYQLEIVVDGYIFPSDQSSRLHVTKSAQTYDDKELVAVNFDWIQSELEKLKFQQKNVSEETIVELIRDYLSRHSIESVDMAPLLSRLTALEQKLEVDLSAYTKTVDLPNLRGEKGEEGQAGRGGQDGINGLSAYELALENGFKGSLVEWLQSLKGEKGDKGEDVPTQMRVSKSYVKSLTSNLLVNGDGSLGDNTNFKRFSYDQTDSYFSIGSFTTSTQNAVYDCDDFMTVDPNRTYEFTNYMKANPQHSGRQFMYVSCYDVDEKAILYHHIGYLASSLTSLARPLNPGDTVIYLTDLPTAWQTNLTDSTKRNLMFWNYENSQGYNYGVETYTQHIVKNAFEAGGVNVEEKSITLRQPYSGVQFSAGHPLSRGADGATYSYVGQTNFLVTESWVKYGGTISGLYNPTRDGVSAKFRHGTAKVKVGWLLNRGTTERQTIWLSNILFREKFFSQEEATMLSHKVSSLEGQVTDLARRLTKLETK